MEIIGFSRNNFKTQDGVEINGVNLYLTSPVAKGRGEGLIAESLYVTDRRLAACGISLDGLVGKDVIPVFNRRGKLERLIVEG